MAASTGAVAMDNSAFRRIRDPIENRDMVGHDVLPGSPGNLTVVEVFLHRVQLVAIGESPLDLGRHVSPSIPRPYEPHRLFIRKLCNRLVATTVGGVNMTVTAMPKRRQEFEANAEYCSSDAGLTGVARRPRHVAIGAEPRIGHQAAGMTFPRGLG